MKDEIKTEEENDDIQKILNEKVLNNSENLTVWQRQYTFKQKKILSKYIIWFYACKKKNININLIYLALKYGALIRYGTKLQDKDLKMKNKNIVIIKTIYFKIEEYKEKYVVLKQQWLEDILLHKKDINIFKKLDEYEKRTYIVKLNEQVEKMQNEEKKEENNGKKVTKKKITTKRTNVYNNNKSRLELGSKYLYQTYQKI